MRVTKTIILSALAVAACACFVAATRAAIAPRPSNNDWQASLPPARAPLPGIEPVAEVVAEPEAPEPEIALAPLAKRHRRVIAPVEPTTIRTGVDPEDAIRIALRSKRASFEHCYEQELKKQASFSGFIVVALSLSASGTVIEARVQEGNRRDAVVGACIVAQLRMLKLPQLTSEADLLIPIRLQAREPT